MIVSETIRREARRLGFLACGVARAERVEPEMERRLREWLRRGCNATMGWLAQNTEKRLDPRLLVPGVRTLVCVALNYAPSAGFPDGELKLASYALGKDYHDVVKSRLRKLAAAIGVGAYRAFCDTGPVLERYWAQRAGLGWIGRNGQLIIPGAGSMFFLGELFLMEEADVYDAPGTNRCGNCRKCVDACPMDALGHDFFDAEKCLSYQTIENRGELSEEAREHIGDTFYGCDRCIRACPWNRLATATDVEEFRPSDELLSMRRQDWEGLTEEQYRRLFRGSAVKRAKYEGLKRNIEAAMRKEKESEP